VNAKVTVAALAATALLAGCGTFNNIDKDHNKQCKENCNVIEGAAKPSTVVVQPTPVIVQPTPVVVRPAQPVVVEKTVYIERPAVALQTTSVNGYLNGRKHGHWIERVTEAVGGGTEEGQYVDGKRQGNWVVRRANGSVVGRLTYRNGELVN